MRVQVYDEKDEMGAAAADAGAEFICDTLEQNGSANIIVATGASQFELLQHLARTPNVRWNHVTVFHLDEYVGLPITHRASFRRYLWERFHSKLPLPVRAFHYLDGEVDAPGEAKRVGAILKKHPIDVAFIGIGENGHIAFNDPPADFDTNEPYLIVTLDETCRRQQLGEGWFPTLDAVPEQAISMSVKQILCSRHIVCTVPDQRKAEAVQQSIEGEVTNHVPASILQHHASCTLYLDANSASGLTRSVR